MNSVVHMPRCNAAVRDVKILLLIALLACAGGKPPEASVANVRSQIEQGLAVGSSPERGLEFLDSLKVVHSPYKDHGIQANFGRSSQKDLVSGAVYVRLYYDENNQLVRYTIEEILTGP